MADPQKGMADYLPSDVVAKLVDALLAWNGKTAPPYHQKVLDRMMEDFDFVMTVLAMFGLMWGKPDSLLTVIPEEVVKQHAQKIKEKFLPDDEQK